MCTLQTFKASAGVNYKEIYINERATKDSFKSVNVLIMVNEGVP